MVSIRLKHFHDFLGSPKKLGVFFLQFVLNYKTIIFEEALNSNFVNGFSMWYLNMADLNKNWRILFFFVLMKNFEEFHKSIDF